MDVGSLFNIEALQFSALRSEKTSKSSVLVSEMCKVVNGKDIQVFHEKEILRNLHTRFRYVSAQVLCAYTIRKTAPRFSKHQWTCATSH